MTSLRPIILKALPAVVAELEAFRGARIGMTSTGDINHRINIFRKLLANQEEASTVLLLVGLAEAAELAGLCGVNPSLLGGLFEGLPYNLENEKEFQL